MKLNCPIAHHDQSQFSLRFYEELYFPINSRKSSLPIPVKLHVVIFTAKYMWLITQKNRETNK